MTVPKPLREPKSRHRNLCTAIMENGAECQRPVAPEAPTTFCTLHGLLAAQWMIGHHRDLVQRILDVEVEQERQRVADSRRLGANLTHYYKFAVVYYVRLGDRIKIGTSTNLPQRVQQLPVEELLAVEPGGYGRERARHRQFASSRVTGEWFTPTPELGSLIMALRMQYGDPLKFWEQATTRRSA